MIFGGIAYAGYLGFILAISKVLGTNSVRDLGVSYTEQDFKSYTQKSKETYSADIDPKTPPSQSIVFIGSNEIKSIFNQEEISARLGLAKWKYMPLSDTQVRIDSNGTVEVSAFLETENLPGFISAVGGTDFSPEELKTATDILGRLGSRPPLYTKFKAEVTNNELTTSIETLQLGRLNLPLDKLEANKTFGALGTYIMGNVEGFYAKSVRFENGAMNFEGTAPAQIQVVSK
jgi:hypothetical protein